MDSVGESGKGQLMLQEKCAERLRMRGEHLNSATPSETLAATEEISLQLTYLGSTGANEFLFRLTATDQSEEQNMLRLHFGLTNREGDVLLWIARGKTNRDIGTILNLSARTVNKHLEQIYIKLGVENRAAAAVKATMLVHR